MTNSVFQQENLLLKRIEQINGREGETATLYERRLSNLNGLSGGFAPRHLKRSIAAFRIRRIKLFIKRSFITIIMRNKITITAFLLFLTFCLSCVKNADYKEQSSSQNQKPAKLLFNVVNLLDKDRASVEKILGNQTDDDFNKNFPNQVTRGYATTEEELSVSYGNDHAGSFTLSFKNDPKDAIEAAASIGIDISSKKPRIVYDSESQVAEAYENLKADGKSFEVYYFYFRDRNVVSTNKNIIKVNVK